MLTRSAYTNRSDLRGLFPRLNPIRSEISSKLLQAPKAKTRRPDFVVRGYGATHVGCKRMANEDSFWILPKQSLFIVADGMGGHAGGQIASTIATHQMGLETVALLNTFEKKLPADAMDIFSILKHATVSANHQVSRITDVYPELESMGSTLTSLLVYGDQAYFSHVGDSRAYLIRDGQLIQMTEDHSYVQELVNFGEITAEQALVHMRRNLILKSISRNSSFMDIEPDIASIKLKQGDRFILCSDGLIEHVRDADILKTVLENKSAEIPKALIRMTNSSEHMSPSGIGTDNTTVVLVEVGKKRRQR